MLSLLSALLLAVLVTAVWRPLWLLWFHPLAKYPGPRLAAVSNLPYVYWTISGQAHQRLRELHDQYGEVVRIRPNSLTYRSPQAWKDIYGHRKPGTLPFSKDPEFFMPAKPGESHMINANEADHSRQKRLLTHAFSERSLRDQEPLIMSYIDLFITRLRGYADRGEKANLEEWLNFLTFDIVGDLAFGEPFGCLEGSDYHPWVATIFKSIKTGAFLRALSVYPFLAAQVRKVMPKSLIQKRIAHYKMSKDKVTQRLATKTERPDFMSYILRYNDERGMKLSEIEVNAGIIIQAGSETTATVLAACVYYLQTHPTCWQKAVEEVRSSFPTDSDITFLATSHLPYLSGVIEESLRMFPPAPGVGPRLVPEGGAVIDGKFVPGKVSVSVPHYAAFRGHTNFVEPDSFLPERWLEGSDKEGRFAGDRREALQPFSFGPRACIGRNLAYAELRTVLAKMLWHFDMTLLPESSGWDKVKSYIVWEKGPLWVRLEDVAGAVNKKSRS